MARTMRKFSAGGAQGRYDRRMADIEKDFKKDSSGKSGKAAEVLAAKRDQRIADAKDDLAKRTGADRTATRAAEKTAESNLTKTRKYGAPKAVTTEAPAGKVMDSMPALTAPKMDSSIGKPQSFKEAFKDARSRLGAGKTFTFGGKSYTTNIAGEGRKPTSGSPSTNKGAGTSTPRTDKGAGKASQSGMSMKELEASVKADNAKNSPAAALKNPPVVADKKSPAPKPEPKETSAQAAARVAKLTGSAKRRENFAGIFGVGSVSNAKANERLAATRAAEKARNAERAKGRTPLISGTDTNAFFQYGAAAAKSNAANKAKGGSVKKEKTMKYAKGGSTPPKPSAADRARSKAQLDSLKKAKTTPAEGKVVGSANRSEGPGYKKGGTMASCGMAKGGKATKFGAAMKKKSADTKGRAMVKMASGGSVSKRADGCAVKGKTKGKMLAMGGMAGYKRGGKTC